MSKFHDSQPTTLSATLLTNRQRVIEREGRERERNCGAQPKVAEVMIENNVLDYHRRMETLSVYEILHWRHSMHRTTIAYLENLFLVNRSSELDFFGRSIGRAILFYFGPVVSSSFFLLFFLAFSAVGDWMSTILPHIMKCAARGSLKIQDAKITQKIDICAPSHNFVSYIFATNTYINNRKKFVKQQYLLRYGERRPTNSWDRFTSLGHSSKFQRVSGLGFITAPCTSLNGGQSNFARQCVHEKTAP